MPPRPRLTPQQKAERYVTRILDQLTRLSRVAGLSAGEIRQAEAAIHVETEAAIRRLLAPRGADVNQKFTFGKPALEAEAALEVGVEDEAEVG